MSRSKAATMMHYDGNKLVLKPLGGRRLVGCGETERRQVKYVIKVYMSRYLAATVTAAPPETQQEDTAPDCETSQYYHHGPHSICLTSAVAAVFFSQLTVSSSASCSLVRPPSSCVSRHELTM